MILELSKIHPNPFRDVLRNPLNEDKITELIASINDTGFWENVVVRKVPNGYELAYGHHRLEAARRAGIKSADFIVKDLDDAAMLKIMARENSEVYKYSVLSLLESVRGVVVALADERIPAFEVDPKTNKSFIRYAPSFAPGELSGGDSHPHPYTTGLVAQFLGYTEKKGDNKEKASAPVIAALNALFLIQIGKLTEKQIQNMPIDGNPGLLQMTRDLVKRVSESKAEIAVAEKKQAEATRKLSAIDAEQHERVAEAKRKQDDLIKKEIEARQQRDVVAAKEAVALRKQEEERQKARTELYKKRRGELEVIVEKRKKEEAEAQAKDKNLPTRYAVRTMLGKLKLISSESFAFREEVKTLARNPAVTLMERDLLYKAMKEAAQWYSEWAEKFAVTPKHTGVLVEARKREDAKRKLDEATKETK